MPLRLSSPSATTSTASISSIRLPNAIASTLAAMLVLSGFLGTAISAQPACLFVGFFLAMLTLTSLQIANAWERAIILRAGNFQRVAGPGIFFIIPAIDTIAMVIDQRTQTDTFTAEVTLTKDTVPVTVDAVLFWIVRDPKRAALEVASYATAISWAAQTALRDTIGATTLNDLLSNRRLIDEQLQKTIDQRTEPWGISVQAVEIRDVQIPSTLQDAMSREAQADRERHARVILGEAERQIAQSFLDAAKLYESNEIALHLRALNILYEGFKQNGTIFVVPSSAIETMNLGQIGGFAGMASNAAKP